MEAKAIILNKLAIDIGLSSEDLKELQRVIELTERAAVYSCPVEENVTSLGQSQSAIMLGL